MSDTCRWLHEALEALPAFRYPFEVACLPLNGIYFFYEDGETWGHGSTAPKIVRVGTHRGDNFRKRISEHYLLNPGKMVFHVVNPKPADRSIFRKNLGRCILNQSSDPYLKVWEQDFTYPSIQVEWGHIRDIPKEQEVEVQITDLLRNNFSFKFIIIKDEAGRLGEGGLERRLIGTVSSCEVCGPSAGWFGQYSPVEKIRKSGLWQVQHLWCSGITALDMERIHSAILDTNAWLSEKDCI